MLFDDYYFIFVPSLSLSLSLSGSWRQVSPGGGFNQYHPYIPSARFLHAGAPINTSTFAIFGGCARYVAIRPNSRYSIAIAIVKSAIPLSTAFGFA